jgi:hypothetical protein
LLSSSDTRKNLSGCIVFEEIEVDTHVQVALSCGRVRPRNQRNLAIIAFRRTIAALPAPALLSSPLMPSAF